MTTSPPATRPEATPVLISDAILTATLDYVRKLLGRAAVDALLKESGVDARSTGGFVTDSDFYRVIRKAVTLTGEPDLGYRTGEQLMVLQKRAGVDNFLRSTGSVAAAFEVVVDYGSNMSANRVSRVASSAQREIRITSKYGTPPTDNFFCRFGLGYYANVPRLFGAAGVAAETRCQVRGDDECEFVIRWSDPPADADDADAANAAGNAIARVIEDIHATASDLARANDVDAALDAILDRVGKVIMAPRFALSVRLRDSMPARVHTRNVPDDVAGDLARCIEAGKTDTALGTAVVAPVAGMRPYGFLAAILAPDMTCTDIERRFLHAYAGYAAVILETAHAFEQAARDRDTAQSLLDLATELAAARSAADVGSLVASAARHVVGAGDGNVWLYTGEGTLDRVAPAGRERSYSSAAMPEILAMRANPRPICLRPADLAPTVRRLFEETETTCAVVAPIVARGDVLGLVTLSYFDEAADAAADEALTRLAALADLAAGALDNVRLLERVQHQASHDPLTGLPNRVLARERGQQHLADAPASTALLFIDLDDFKGVNDQLGHAAGDRLLQIASQRIEASVRSSDTVARFAGDEFLAILSNCASAEEANVVAHRVETALSQPFSIDGKRVEIQASVGVSFAPLETDYDELLKAADGAMYGVKSARRRTARVSVANHAR